MSEYMKLPRSLFARNVLLIIALLGVSQLVSVLLLRELVVKPRIEQLARYTATTLEAIRYALRALPAEQRDRFIAQINQRGSIQIRVASEPLSGFGKPERPLLRRYIEMLADLLPDDETEVEWKTEPANTLWIRLNLADQSYWVSAAAGNIDAGLPRVSLLLSVICAALALLGAVLIRRLLDKPFRELMAASERLGKGQLDTPLPENGPLEVAAVSRSFNRMAERLTQAERERAIMLAGVSHDLRSPLAKLRLATEILGENAEPELVRGMVSNIESMDQIIGQFLDFARAGSAETLQDCDLPQLLRSTLAGIQGGECVALQLDAALTLPLRPLALQRMLANLVDNALRYGEAPYALSLQLHGDEVWISVCDHGPGIPPEQAEQLKQAFVRGDLARGGPPGTGLGLAIVERIAQQHGGRLALLPMPAGGLEARVCLPQPAG